MAWVYLIVAGLLEIIWAIGMKYSAGFTRPWPSLITLAAAFASFYYLSLAVETLPVGTSYAIWTGIGAVGTSVLGIVLFGEPTSPWRLLCIALVIAGVLGLKLTASASVATGPAGAFFNQ